MKLNKSKFLLTMMLTSVVVTGCSTVDTEEEAVDAGAVNVSDEATETPEAGSENNGAETRGANFDAQMQAEQLAAQRAREAAEREQATLRETKTVYFDFDQSKIKPESKPVLAAHAAFLAANPSVKIVVEGHCDERGTKGYNIALGERRGNSVAKFLLVNGVSKSQIEVVSYGEERPVNNGHDESAWAQNRRAYIAYQ